jgi:glycosyltransferase involved in cell wall biosynthesis
MAAGMRQIQSIRELGIATEVVDMRGIPKLKYLQVLPRLRRAVPQVDVIHAHFGYCGWLAVLANIFQRRKTPIVMSFMGDDLLGTPYNDAGELTWTSRWEVRWNQRMARLYQRVIVKSPEMAGVLPGIACQVVPNGVDIQAFRPMDRAQACRDLGLKVEGLKVLFPGNPDNPRKAYPLAKEAVAIAQTRLHKPIEILVLKGVEPQQVPVYMNACDAMLMTSFVEGSPNVVKEAMATNLPVLGVPVGDVHALLEGVEHCWRCSRDPKELGDSLAEALAAPRRTNGREVILQRGLDLESVARRIESIYHQAIQGVP